MSVNEKQCKVLSTSKVEKDCISSPIYHLPPLFPNSDADAETGSVRISESRQVSCVLKHSDIDSQCLIFN